MVSPGGKDRWDKADILLKGVFAVLIGALSTYYTIETNNRRSQEQKVLQDDRDRKHRALAEEQQINRQSQVFSELIGVRQQSQMQLRAQVFNSLLSYYLQQDALDHKILLLELIGINFRNALHVKPLFEVVEEELATRNLSTSEAESYRKKLHRAARKIVGYQLDQIAVSEDGIVVTDTLDLGRSKEVIVGGNSVTLTLLDVGATGHGVRIRAGWPDWFAQSLEPFVVNYFDMPFSDYTVVRDAEGDLRYAVVLLDRDAAGRQATVSVAKLPSVFDFDNTFYFEEKLQNLVVSPSDSTVEAIVEAEEMENPEATPPAQTQDLAGN